MNQKTKALAVVAILLFLLITAVVFAQRTSSRSSETAEKNSGGTTLKGQFLSSGTCVFTQCGWPAILIIILPVVAVYVWKKFFSWG